MLTFTYYIKVFYFQTVQTNLDNKTFKSTFLCYQLSAGACIFLERRGREGCRGFLFEGCFFCMDMHARYWKRSTFHKIYVQQVVWNQKTLGIRYTKEETVLTGEFLAKFTTGPMIISRISCQLYDDMCAHN